MTESRVCRGVFRFSIVVLLCACAMAGPLRAEEPEFQRPVIEGEWWSVAGDPDLGEYTSPRQQPVDFGIWQAADGTWQLWSCIRNTKCGGHTRLFYRWEGQHLTDTDWQPMGIAMEADTSLGETKGGLQAPYVFREDGTYWMFYGDWKRICLARSEDGKEFTRVLGEDGEPDLFSGPYPQSRDAMVMRDHGLYYCYYTGHLPADADAEHLCAVFCRVSSDMKHWSEALKVCAGGWPSGMTWHGGDCECPFVARRNDYYVLFRNQHYGHNNHNTQYASANPLYFGVDSDRYMIGTLPVAAPEVFEHEGQWYVAALKPSLKGIRIARLKWVDAEPGDLPVVADADELTENSLFDFDDSDVRSRWELVEGEIDPIFTTSDRQHFGPVYEHFIGTSESQNAVQTGRADDGQTGVIESPPFESGSARYVVLVSGGADSRDTYVSLIDDQTGEELARWAGNDNNAFQRKIFDARKHAGRTVRIRIVDRAKDGWGHINFGGIFRFPAE